MTRIHGRKGTQRTQNPLERTPFQRAVGIVAQLLRRRGLWRGRGCRLRTAPAPAVIHNHACAHITRVKLRVALLEHEHLLVQLVPQQADDGLDRWRQRLRLARAGGDGLARRSLRIVKLTRHAIQRRYVGLRDAVIRQPREIRRGQSGNAVARRLQDIGGHLVELRQRQLCLCGEVHVIVFGGQRTYLAGDAHDFILVIMAHQHLFLLLANDRRFLDLRLAADRAEGAIQRRHGGGDGLVAGPDG